MISQPSGLLDAGPTLRNLVGGSSDSDGGEVSVTSTDSGTSSSDEYDYRGQEELADLYTPTLDDPAIDEDGYQGEGSWMDFQEDEDGAGSRYDRDTPWTTDVALQFDTDTVQDLTVPEVDFSEEERAAFADPGQTLDDIAADVQESVSGGVDATPAENVPEGFNQGGPGVVLDRSGGGILSSPLVIGAVVVSVVLSVVGAIAGTSGGETDG